ncbi:MAG: UvrD-helicase domain-containing protein [Muribaculaceae bacterium]|nr:UvrD-helicase domain-containing protein [Muribaculaceae bacterium]
MLNIYRASAGSGKTYTLAFEYIKIILGKYDPETGRYRLNKNPNSLHRHILAITFTVKATEEMKKRIIHEIALIAGLEPGYTEKSNYLGDLCTLFGCTEDDLAAAARVALGAILNDYSFFTVSTIDAFFQTILRTFAREAELTGNYEVELDDNEAIIYGVNNMFQSLDEESIYADTPEERSRLARQRQLLRSWIFRYMNNKIEEGKSFDIFNRASNGHDEVVKLIDNVSTETFKIHFDRIMDYLKDTERINTFAIALANHVMDFRRGLAERFTALKKYIDANPGLYYAPAKVDKRGTLNKNAFEFVNKFQDSTVEITSSAATPLNIADDYLKFFSAYGQKSEFADDDRLRCLIVDAFGFYRDNLWTFVLIRSISKTLFILGLMERVYDNVNKFATDNNLILLSDTTSLLQKIISGDETPFVYERIGQYFNHFLIDEFQDTSRLQWENLRPLLNESLSKANDNLIIGDVKQCIYRFRDSDPTLLRNIGDDFPRDANPIKDNLEGNSNYRSAREIVTFNNTLFLNLGRALGHGDIYDHVVQPVPRKRADDHGHVKAIAFPYRDDEFKEKVLERIIVDINEALDHGFSPEHIAILVRRRSDGQDVINHIMENVDRVNYPGVRLVSDDAMGLGNAPIVRLIVSVLGYIAELDSESDKKKRQSAAQRIAHLINHFEHQLAELHDESAALASALSLIEDARLDDDEPFTAIDIQVAEVIKMTCLSLPSLVERITASFINADRAATDNLYISAFQDLVLDYSERNGSDLRAFLDWWSSTGKKAKVAGAVDPAAIRVMTIHKAKGLEFPVTIVPFVCEEIPKFRSPEWFETPPFDFIKDKDCIPPLVPIVPAAWMENIPVLGTRYKQLISEQTLDELNVIYVALTRAKQVLTVYLSAYRNPDPKKTSTSISLGRYVEDAIEKSTDAMVNSWIDSNPEARALAVPPLIPIADFGRPLVEETVESDKGNYKLKTVCYTIGEYPRFVQEKKTDRKAVDPTGRRAMPPYISSDRPDIWNKTRLDDPTINAAVERGNAIHAILSRIVRIGDIEKAVRNAVHQGIIHESEREEILHLLTTRLNEPDVKPWFEGFHRVLIERTISNVGGLHKHRRPDRVVWTSPSTIVVIDYKTGDMTKEAAHRVQVTGYINLLARITGASVTGYLWYLDTDTIRRV